MIDTLQTQCDRLTHAVLWRRSRQTEKPPLYLVEMRRKEEVGVAIVAHDTPCIREVWRGGNAGMGYADTFRGAENPNFEFRGVAMLIFRLDGWDDGAIEAKLLRVEAM